MHDSLNDNLTQNTSKISQIITNLVIANAIIAQNFRSTHEKIISKNKVYKQWSTIFVIFNKQKFLEKTEPENKTVFVGTSSK